MGYRNEVKKKRNKIIVTPQTLYNLHRLAELYGYNNIGKVVDNLVKEKVMKLSGGNTNVHSQRKSNS